ncbi:YtxH domain-containing protein [Zhaonella formicivorans]|jgi:gas vesicle protein|uniref:YtxH domain-containing protein n=1 Tax=Zhaonella formicivorans TaxID=2528593 RepID=UPI0010ECB668|nr:YtxH domain-containing protein [Zhaonella formicivorans]
MFKGFWKGLLTGGIIGAIISSNLFMTPQKKKIVSKRIMGKTRRLQSRARKVMKEVSEGVNDLLQK